MLAAVIVSPSPSSGVPPASADVNGAAPARPATRPPGSSQGRARRRKRRQSPGKKPAEKKFGVVVKTDTGRFAQINVVRTARSRRLRDKLRRGSRSRSTRKDDETDHAGRRNGGRRRKGKIKDEIRKIEIEIRAGDGGT
jgi:hypothetical protein